MVDKASQTTEATVEKNEDAADGPIGDPTQETVKKMIATAKERGYITYDELNASLPQDEMSSEQIEDVMTMLSEMGINVIDGDEAEEYADDDQGTSSPGVKKSGKKSRCAR